MSNGLTQAQAAELLGVSTRRLRQIEKETTVPRSVNADGRTIEYPPRAYGEWLRDRWQAGAGDSETINPQHERALLDRARRVHQEMINQQKSGDLVSASDMIQAGQDIILTTRNKLLALPNRLASVCPGPDQARIFEESTREVRQVLTDLACGIEETFGDPKKQPMETDHA